MQSTDDSIDFWKTRCKRLERTVENHESTINQLEEDFAHADARETESQETISRLERQRRIDDRTKTNLEYENQELVCERAEMMAELEGWRSKRQTTTFATRAEVLSLTPSSPCLEATQAIYSPFDPSYMEPTTESCDTDAECGSKNVNTKVQLGLENDGTEELPKVKVPISDTRNRIQHKPTPPAPDVNVNVEACKQLEALLTKTHTELTVVLAHRIERAKARARPRHGS